MTVIRELVTKLGFDVDDEAFNKAENLVGKLKVGLGIVSAAAATAGGAVLAMVDSLGQQSGELLRQASITGVTVEELQKLQFAAGQSNVSVESLSGGLKFLSRNMGEAIGGSKSQAEAFGKIGISVDDLKRMSPTEVLAKIADAMKNAPDAATRTALSMELLGRGGADMVPLLEQGGAAILALTKQASDLGFVIDQATAESADAFSDKLDALKGGVSGLKNAIAAEFLPVMHELIDGLMEWWKANKELVKDRLSTVLRVLTGILGSLWAITRRVAAAFGWLVEKLGGLESALKLVGVAMLSYGIYQAAILANGLRMGLMFLLQTGGLSALSLAWIRTGIAAVAAQLAMLAIPALIIAGIALVILVIEDLYMWFTGEGDSAIGQALGSWSQFSMSLRDIWIGIQDAIGGSIESVIIWMTSMGDTIKGIWTSVVDWIFGKIDAVTGKISAVRNYVSGLFGGGGETSTISAANAGATSAVAGSTGIGVMKNSMKAQVNVNVPPGTNKEQADYIADSVQRAIYGEWGKVAAAYPQVEQGQ